MAAASGGHKGPLKFPLQAAGTRRHQALGLHHIPGKHPSHFSQHHRHCVPSQHPSKCAAMILKGRTMTWRHVCLQEQSQAPALGGKDTLESYEALSGLVQFAKERNAHTVLLMTWGYLEGDRQAHPAIFPDYHAMQVWFCLTLQMSNFLMNESYLCQSIRQQSSDLAGGTETGMYAKQERLANGYLSLAARIREEHNISSSIAPAGLAWQHIHTLQHGRNAVKLPAGMNHPALTNIPVV